MVINVIVRFKEPPSASLVVSIVDSYIESLEEIAAWISG
jgi:hypothetical protein